MIRKTFIALLLVFGTVTSAAAADIVTFKGTTTTEIGDMLMLTGKLTKPKGDGPFHAVVVLHGCSGLHKYFDVWAERLASWGYVTLQVDSFGPRGESNICRDSILIYDLLTKRAQDAYDAKSYLVGLPFVDPNRIAVMGWSHGGWTTLFVVRTTSLAQKREDPFRAAIAFYPYCSLPLDDLNAPLLILIGELDDWCPASMCFSRMPLGKTVHEVILKVHPRAYHCFDWEGIDVNYMGHRLQYDPAAAADAIIQVREFLVKHFQ